MHEEIKRLMREHKLDLQNLPFDPAEVLVEEWMARSKSQGSTTATTSEPPSQETGSAPESKGESKREKL